MRPSALPLGVYGCALTVCSLLVSGIEIYTQNHAIQVPLVRWINDPSLYPGDPFIASLSRYPTTLWYLVALLARAFPLGPLLVVLLAIERLFVICAAGRLARALVPGSRLAVVGAMALFAFAMNSLLAAGTIVPSFFEQTGLSIGCFLLAAAAFHEKRLTAWAVWAAIGFTLTSLYGTFALSYFAAVGLCDGEYRREWRRFVRPVLLFLALASYTIFLGARSLRGEPVDTALWLSASRLRGWQHLYMNAWDRADFAVFGAVAAVILVALWVGRRRFPRVSLHGAIWSAVVLGWLLVAYAAAYLVPSLPLLMLQPARASDVFLALAGTAAVAIAADLVERQAGGGAGPGRAALLLFAACFLAWMPRGWMAAAIILIALLVFPAWRSLLGIARRPVRGFALVLAGWAACAGLLSFRERLLDWDTIDMALVFRPEPELREVAEWARTKTSKDAVFLVNVGYEPEFDSFPALAERSIFTNWDQGTSMFWQPSSVTGWAERMRMIGFDVGRPSLNYQQELDTLYSNLRDINVGVLKGRVPLRYWIVTVDHPSRFPVVFQNSEYKVLDLEA